MGKTISGKNGMNLTREKIMLRNIPLMDGAAFFEGSVSLETMDGGVHPFRLRSEERPLLNEELTGRADIASGVRVVVITDSEVAELDMTVTGSEEEARVDAVIEGRIVNSCGFMPTGARQTVRFDGLPSGQKRLELWLPLFGCTTVLALRLAGGASAERYDDRRPKWITYGSSITMCRTAHSPARTWPAIVARRHDLNLTSLGFGGQCHFDPLVARTIRDMPADCISLKLGINTHGEASFTPRTWGPAVLGFILAVRDGHPDTPLLVCSPIFCRHGESTPNRTDMTLAQMRVILEDLVARLRDRGDIHIHYLNGLSLFDLPDADQGLMPDDLHPNGDGYELMGRRFAELAFATQGPFNVQKQREIFHG